MVLFDFTAPEQVTRWSAVDDVVMGGRSGSGLTAEGGGVAVFSGTVSLEHGGGFASVRAPVPAGSLRGYEGIELRVRGDGKRYKVNLRVDEAFDGIPYRGEFRTIDGERETLRIPFSDFHPVFRGRAVAGAPVLDPAKVCGLGFLISGRQAGRFRLEIDYIAGYVQRS